MLDKLGKSLSFQSDALVLRSKRQAMITSNIANSDTPGYKATDVNFSKVLSQKSGKTAPSSSPGANSQPKLAMAKPEGASSTMIRTSSFHMEGKPVDTSLLAESAQYRRGSTASIDGNSVNLEVERASFAENTVKYEAALKSLNGRIQTLMDAIKGNGR